MSENKKKRRTLGLILIPVVVLALSLIGVASAKYITAQQNEAELHAADFHFSSDILSPNFGSIYDVSDWRVNGIRFKLYNYEIDNEAQISSSAIEYSVTLPAGWTVDSVTDDAGSAVTDSGGNYTLAAGTAMHYHTVVVKYTGTGTPANCSISVTSVSPYEKQLKAIFRAVDNGSVTYAVSNNQDSCVLTIYSNSYAGSVKVIWDSSKCAPDNTNSLMTAWQNSSATTGETFTAELYHTYTLCFLKNSTSVSLSDSDFNVSEGN